MKIVILEADSLGQDMVFTPFEALGEVVIYRSTTADEMEEKTGEKSGRKTVKMTDEGSKATEEYMFVNSV